MNKHFQIFNEQNRLEYKPHRYHLNIHDTKVLEDSSTTYASAIEICENLEEIANIKASYILIGIPEDIGVRANLGRAGASEAWNVFLKSFLGLQHSKINDGSRFCVLGKVVVVDLMNEAQNLDSLLHDDRVRLSDLVKLIDQRVSEIVTKIIAAGKMPIVIGGGHNNSYPLLRSSGYNHSVDCINIDAHTDLRPSIGRHSGNGFTHAVLEGYLKSYFMMGIQENYLSQPMIDFMDNNDQIDYSVYRIESLKVISEVEKAMNHIDSSRFSLEIDMDVVANFPSSAQSPVGYTFQELRNLVNEIIKQASSLPKYIHICEAAPKYGYENQVGKALATLVNDLP